MENCSYTKHYFAEGSRKCFCGKADIWWYQCPRCKTNNVSKYRGIVCNKCLNDPKYRKEIKEINKNGHVIVKKYKDAVAFGYDKKTGKPIAIDNRGKKFDPSETRYNFKRDPHGWRATGKKVRELDKYKRKQ